MRVLDCQETADFVEGSLVWRLLQGKMWYYMVTIRMNGYSCNVYTVPVCKSRSDCAYCVLAQNVDPPNDVHMP